MVIFTALFVAVITLLFGHLIFHQRIKHFMREDVVGEVLRRLSGKRDTDGGIRANDAEAGEPLDQQSTPSVSSPKGINGSEFEVFLSFRGEDTRKGFTGHLYEGLKLRCVSTFKDDENLEKGREIDKLLEYIEKSKIFVPIFSQRYAESIWCLKEITKSVECGKEIVPVFFGVKPSVVRSQSGVFRSAFEKHASNKKLNQEEVRKWREALKKVAHISGFDLDDMNGDEVKLKCAIIERVLSKVNKKPFEVAKHPIGIETRVQDVKKMLEGEGITGVRVVGIHGMGGLGKTSIARAVYTDLAQAFNCTRCFLLQKNLDSPMD